VHSRQACTHVERIIPVKSTESSGMSGPKRVSIPRDYLFSLCIFGKKECFYVYLLALFWR
jgi:hypothetical protein